MTKPLSSKNHFRINTMAFLISYVLDSIKKRANLLVLTILLIGSTCSTAQTFEWAKTYQGTSTSTCWSVTTDSWGNVYSTGTFSGTVDFDPGPGTYNVTSLRNSTGFIQKLDPNGIFLWVKVLGDGSREITVDKSGNIYSFNLFSLTKDFDPGVGTSNLTSAGGIDLAIIKLDSNGNFIWAKKIGGSNDIYVEAVNTDANDNLYITGYFQGTIDFNPGFGTYNITASGSSNAYVLKLDSNGNINWARAFLGSVQSYGNSIDLDSSGNIYTAGYFAGTVDFDPGPGVDNHTANGANYDAYIQKMDANGSLLWVVTYGGFANDYCESIAVDKTGNVYATGGYQATVDFDPGTGVHNLSSSHVLDAFVQKLDANGNFIWVKSMGGNQSIYLYKMTLDALSNIYMTGFYRGTVDFDPGAGLFNISSLSGHEGFVHKMSQVLTEVNEFEVEDNIMIFPNPSRGVVHINLKAELKNAQFVLMDILGQEISRKTYDSVFKTNIELPQLKGLYLLTIQTKDSKQIFKLLKE